MPKRVMGAGGGNDKGHWEPERLVAAAIAAAGYAFLQQTRRGFADVL
ncbi:MAG: hypothetical protein ACREH9_08750 [Pseudomonadota bacterium]